MNYRDIRFPPVETADADGLLAAGRNLDCDMLLAAYTHGIFPWPCDPGCILWFSPPQRTILELATARISPKLRRDFKNRGFEFRINTVFEEVIDRCAAVRRNADGTWITPELRRAYVDFHRLGFAFSFETFRENRLVGGLYGTWINRFFAGESMFHLESGASKFALAETVAFLRDRAGLAWIDVQMPSPLLLRLGAREISRTEFLRRLNDALAVPVAEPAAAYHQTQHQVWS